MMAPDQVELWTVSLSEPANRQREDLLSPDERSRAERFRLFEHRARFVAGRAALRGILAHHLACPPAAVPLVSGARGKPALDTGVADLRFNLTHAGALALVALSIEREVGVDLEPFPSASMATEISRLVLCEAERRRLERLDEARRTREFARIWTRKEAYLKGLGLGFALPPHRLDATALDETMLVLHDVEAIWKADEAWVVRSVTPPPGHALAVAAAGAGWTLVRRSWGHAAVTPGSPGTTR